MQGLGLDTCILDVYIDIAPRYKAWLQDVSPFIPGSDRLENQLFTWAELAELGDSASLDEEQVVEIRTADSASQLRPKKDYANRFPVEL